MCLITCGSIHEGHEWFSDDSRGRRDFLCLWLLYYVSNFADSQIEVPRYRSSPAVVLGKITSMGSKLPTAAC